MKKTALGLTLLLTLLLLAGTAMAHRDGGGMMRSDDGYGFCDRYNDADSDEVKAITDKYKGEFEALRKKMTAKRDEMQKARSNDETTVGQLNKLRDEMRGLKKEQRTLADKIDAELSEKFGDVDDDHYGMMGGGRHGMMGDDDHRYGKRGGHRGYGDCR